VAGGQSVQVLDQNGGHGKEDGGKGWQIILQSNPDFGIKSLKK